jgi:hypothetical protein
LDFSDLGIFMSDFAKSSPVTSIDYLGYASKLLEGIRLANPGNFILNSGWESLVILVLEGVLVSSELSRETVKLNIVLCDPIVVVHDKHINVIFGIAMWIGWTKIVSEFLCKLIPIFEP